jgi:hypothetical protein
MIGDPADSIIKRPACQTLIEMHRKHQILLVDTLVSPRYKINKPASNEEIAPMK